MTFAELVEAFNTYIGAEDQADNAQLALWFNEAQLDLAYELGRVQSVTVDVAPGGVYTPPQDWLILLGGEPEYQRLPNGDLSFPHGGAGRLFYRAQPTAFSGSVSAQESDLPPAVHFLLALFAAARYWDVTSEGDGQESSHASKWLSYYYQGKNMAKSRLLGSGWDIQGWTLG